MCLCIELSVIRRELYESQKVVGVNSDFCGYGGYDGVVSCMCRSGSLREF